MVVSSEASVSGHAQPAVEQTEVGLQNIAWALMNDMPTLEDQRLFRDRKNLMRMLFDEDHGNAAFADRSGKARAVFGLATNGVNTARDEWVYDFDVEALRRRMNFAVTEFNRDQ